LLRPIPTATRRMEIVTGPIFSPPYASGISYDEKIEGYTLLVAPILAGWFCLSLLYIGSLFLFRPKERIAETQTRVSVSQPQEPPAGIRRENQIGSDNVAAATNSVASKMVEQAIAEVFCDNTTT